MSTDIITNQLCVSFPLQVILDDYNLAVGKEVSRYDVQEEFSRMFGGYDDLYLYLEASCSSNVYPKLSSWFNCVPVSHSSELVCNYIKKALTSFEGGMSRFKGSNYTKPEAALARLRKNINEAIDIRVFSKFNPSGLEFHFNLFDSHTSKANVEDIMLCDQLLADMDYRVINDKYKASQSGFSSLMLNCKKCRMIVKHPRDIINIIVLANIAKIYDRITQPVINTERISKPSRELINALV